MDTKLDPYQDYLDRWTAEGQDYSHFDRKPLGRFHTMRYAFEWYRSHNGKVVVELGTLRSFVHGGHSGCNQPHNWLWDKECPENWDWGSGMFSRMAAICLGDLHPHIHTVDIVPEHIRRCQVMTQDFAHLFSYHTCSSVEFLQRISEPVDVLYLDTGDMTPVEDTAALQAQEALLVIERSILSPTGLLVIDDVRNTTPFKYGDTSGMGKSKYSLPLLKENGFSVVMDEYQVVMTRG